MVSCDRVWNLFGRFRGFSDSSAGSLGQIYGYIQSRVKARGTLVAVIYTVICVHNANFNLSRCHHRYYPQRYSMPIFRKSRPEHDRNRRMKRRWGESKGEGGRSNERDTKQLPRIDDPRNLNGVLGRSIFIVNLSIDNPCQRIKRPVSIVEHSWQISDVNRTKQKFQNKSNYWD